MALPFSDNFNRASLGAGYTVMRGAFTMPGSVAAMPDNLGGHSTAWDNTNTYGNDQYAEIVISNASFDGYAGVAARCDTAGAITLYGWHGSLFEQTLFKFVAGTYTQLGNVATAFNNGDVIRLECIGTTITAKQNGVTKFSVTDSSIAAGSAGIQGYTSVAGTNTSADSFAAGNIVLEQSGSFYAVDPWALDWVNSYDWSFTAVAPPSNIADQPPPAQYDIAINVIAALSAHWGFDFGFSSVAIDDGVVSFTVVADASIAVALGAGPTAIQADAQASAAPALAVGIGPLSASRADVSTTAAPALAVALGASSLGAVVIVVAAAPALAVGFGPLSASRADVSTTVAPALGVAYGPTATPKADTKATAAPALAVALGADSTARADATTTAASGFAIGVGPASTARAGVSATAAPALAVALGPTSTSGAGTGVNAASGLAAAYGPTARAGAGVATTAASALAVALGAYSLVASSARLIASPALAVALGADASATFEVNALVVIGTIRYIGPGATMTYIGPGAAMTRTGPVGRIRAQGNVRVQP